MSESAFPGTTAAEIAKGVRSGAVTARAVTEAALDRIAALNPKLNAYTDVTAERAVAAATALDIARQAGDLLVRSRAFPML